MEEIYSYLQTYGVDIGKKASDGDVLCSRIISAYKMHYSCKSDPGARGILSAVVKEYWEREANGKP